MPEHIVRDIEPLLQREKRLLRAAVRDADDELIENARCAPDDVVMPAGERVERTRIHGDNHELSPLLFTLSRVAATTRSPRFLVMRPKCVQGRRLARTEIGNAHYSSFSRRSK